jgi:hypothetical protein
LLFVHGVGEQKRFDHLRSSVLELAEVMRRVGARATVVDRTASWSLPPGCPHPSGIAPIELLVVRDHTIVFDCHEVWWADLGTRSGPLDAIGFWLWGLGQWCAPIYRDVDITKLRGHRGSDEEEPIATLPRSVAGLWRELSARVQLLMAALAAAFIGTTWSLAKRLLGAVLGEAPSPNVIVQYLGDLRTYESRAAPGDSALTDPGYPRRVGIRRRMVTEMVAMGTRNRDWYVLAHSLGTVVAYNGLTEIGHTLPNYLPRRQWDRLPAPFKRDKGARRRQDRQIGAMMPARPPWLAKEDVINRELLFARLKGFLTYGSPLDKFAGLWPLIVATATDRKPGAREPIKHVRWVNLVAPTDPVAGGIDSFAGPLSPVLPEPENLRTRWSWAVGLAHITYFAGFERFRAKPDAEQKKTIAQWLLGAQGAPDAGLFKRQHWLRSLYTFPFYLALIALIWAATAAVAVFAWEAVSGLTGHGLKVTSLDAFCGRWRGLLLPVMAFYLLLIVAIGLFRWFREAGLNLRLAMHDRKEALKAEPSDRLRAYWKTVVLMMRLSFAGSCIALLSAPAVALIAWYGLIGGTWSGLDISLHALALFAFAALLHTGINRISPA